MKTIRFRKVSRRYLDLELSTTNDIAVRIVERPGLWMPHEEVTKMIEELRSVVAAVLDGRGLDYGVFTGEKQALARAVITLVYDRSSGRPIAFNVLSLLGLTLRGREVEVIHLGLAMVHPRHRGRGLTAVLYGLTCTLLFFRRQMRPICVTNVSQVPSVIGLVGETLSNVYPSPEPRKHRSFDHLMIAREIMSHHRGVFGVGGEAGFDERRFVIRNAYTGGSNHLKKRFAEVSPHRMELYNRMCKAELDYEVGDDFLQVGQIDRVAARNFLLRNVPRAWLPSLLFRLMHLLVGSSLLPVLHWLSPGRPMGDLRPWKR